MNKTVIGLVVFVVLTGGIAFAALNNDTSESTTQQPPSSQNNTETPTSNPSSNDDATTNDAASSITVDQVALHASEDDCWTIVGGSVYDITAYLPDHPGGDDILLACGTDGTSLFSQRTTADGAAVGSGTPHSSTAASQLELFKIGELSD